MQFAVEAWDPDYGTGGDVDALDPSTDTVDAAVEVPLGQWQPMSPPESGELEAVYFVDGVRRIDARIWVTSDELVLAGSCATVAAGTVRCEGSTAEVLDAQVLRGVFTPPADDAASIVTNHGTYEHFTVRSGSPEDLYLGIHEQMTNLETRTVPSAGPKDLIVFDGPLRGRQGDRSIGLIKTQHVQYLEAGEQRVVNNLDAGNRTPLFLIGQSGFTRWSWYQRLPGPRTHGWAGVIRCELGGQTPITNAIEVADLATASLPRFASEPHKEHRAPQNLYPIVGLERALRRRLGDQRLMHRALSAAARI